MNISIGGAYEAQPFRCTRVYQANDHKIAVKGGPDE